jgi:hypothetical protein
MFIVQVKAPAEVLVFRCENGLGESKKTERIYREKGTT